MAAGRPAVRRPPPGVVTSTEAAAAAAVSPVPLRRRPCALPGLTCLAGLADDYAHDGRVLWQVLAGKAPRLPRGPARRVRGAKRLIEQGEFLLERVHEAARAAR